MPGITEELVAPNPAEDWTFVAPCGCRVTMTGASLHREYEPQWCVRGDSIAGRIHHRAHVLNAANDRLALLNTHSKM